MPFADSLKKAEYFDAYNAKRKGIREEERLARQSLRSAKRVSAKDIPPHVLADRDRRAALHHATLTAMLMGDPPPGYRA